MAQIRKGLDFLILAQMLTAVSIVSAKYLLADIPLSLLIVTRFLLAGGMLFVLHRLSSERKTKLRTYAKGLAGKDIVFIVGQALCGGVLFNFFMFLGLQYTDANIAGIITSALPAMITVMAWLILKERISRKKSMCIGFATLGLLVISIDKAHGQSVHASLLGNLFVFLALLPEAFYYILCQLHPTKLPPFLASSIINILNGLICLISAWIVGIPHVHLTTTSWCIVFITALASGLFYTFWFLGSRTVDGVLSSLITAVMPISTVLFAWLFLHESLTPLACVGMGLVIFSIVAYAKN